ncbi:MAG: hypothetical protein HC908_01810 [Calothrix sp. SM1_7_51]|nr:hypothetical protein [Calothrix sp. SM1_7_51]
MGDFTEQSIRINQQVAISYQGHNWLASRASYQKSLTILSINCLKVYSIIQQLIQQLIQQVHSCCGFVVRINTQLRYW